MKLRINFFAKPSAPNVTPSSIAHPTGDFDSLDEARRNAHLYAGNPKIMAHSFLIEADDGTISEMWVRDGADWQREGV
jgi:hypothetical protein